MKHTKNSICSIGENLGWKVEWGAQSNGKYVTFSQYSPAGEDFSFDIWYEKIGDVPDRIMEYYNDFDIDEHVEMWIDARRNGVSGVPSTCRLVKDAEDIEEMIWNLAEELRA